jgi:hypothetical protein
MHGWARSFAVGSSVSSFAENVTYRPGIVKLRFLIIYMRGCFMCGTAFEDVKCVTSPSDFQMIIQFFNYIVPLCYIECASYQGYLKGYLILHIIL